MTYRVVWRSEPFDTMGSIIRGYPEYRELLAGALRALSEALGTHPGDVGESRDGDARIEFFYPLGVTYRVFDADREVHIVAVHLTTFLP